MKKASVIILALFLISALFIHKFINRDSPRPNVVLIIIDMLRADKLGAYGFPKDISPELDELAERGIQFMDVTAQCSWTRPSISSFITGMHPRSIGMYKDMENYNILNDKYTTIAEVLKENGYSTFGITANPTINSAFNFQQGFDTYIDSNYIWWWMKDEKGKTHLPDNRQKSFENDTDFAPLNNAVEIFKKAIDYAKLEHSSPSYIQLNIMEVHEYWKLVRPEYKDIFKEVKDDRERGYLASIRQVSHDIGSFIDELTGLPGWDNTLFIIVSDHGEGLNDHPSVAKSKSHGRLLYESQLKVPMIWHNPDKEETGVIGRLSSLFTKDPYSIKPGQVSERVRLLDLMPTLLEHLHIPLPPDVEGLSLASRLRGGSIPELPNRFVAETYFRDSEKIAVYTDKWKYIENRDKQRGAKYRELQPVGIKEDGKSTDQSKKKPKLVRNMRKFLSIWEKNHPKEEPTTSMERPSEEVLQQLKSLGYIN